MSAGTWMLLLVAAAPSGAPNTPRPDPVDAATVRWAERAEGYAARIDASNGSSLVWVGIVAAYINAGEPDRAKEALAHVREAPLHALLDATQVAAWGDDERVVQFAQRFETSDARDAALYWTIALQIQRGAIERARKTVRLIEGTRARNTAWVLIVQALAFDGQYDAAHDAAEHIDAQDAELKNEASGIIDFCRKDGQEFGKRTVARPLRRGFYGPDPYNPWRSLLLMDHPLVIYPNDFRKTKARVNEMGGGEDGALAWLQLAWEYHDRRRPKACNQAIARSRGMLQSASDPNAKANGYCLLADLCVERGDKQQARKLLLEAEQAARGAEIRPADEARGPLRIAVLVRLGEVDAAVDVARSSQGTAAIQNGQCLGEVLAYEGQAGEVEKRLAAAPDDSARGLLCVGAAAGLQRRKASGRLREASREK